MTVGADVKSCYVSIKSAEASLNALALSTTANEKQKVFQEAAMILAGIKEDLHHQVLFLAREEPQYK